MHSLKWELSRWGRWEDNMLELLDFCFLITFPNYSSKVSAMWVKFQRALITHAKRVSHFWSSPEFWFAWIQEKGFHSFNRGHSKVGCFCMLGIFNTLSKDPFKLQQPEQVLTHSIKAGFQMMLLILSLPSLAVGYTNRNLDFYQSNLLCYSASITSLHSQQSILTMLK